MPASSPKIALVSASLCLLVCTLAFMTYYGQVFQPSPILNTNMKFWTLDPAKNRTRPYLWQIDLIEGEHDDVSAYQFEVDKRQALALKVYRENRNSTSVWTTIHVRQDLRGQALSAIFRSKISLWVFPTFPYWYDPESKNPHNAYGIEINDGTNLIWYVFADEPSKVFQLPHHRIILVQTKLNSWSLREIDISREYILAGWKKPDSISFILILGSTQVHPGTWVGYFSGIAVNVTPLQTENLSSSVKLSILLGDALAIVVLTGIALSVKGMRHKRSNRAVSKPSSDRTVWKG